MFFHQTPADISLLPVFVYLKKKAKKIRLIVSVQLSQLAKSSQSIFFKERQSDSEVMCLLPSRSDCKEK